SFLTKNPLFFAGKRLAPSVFLLPPPQEESAASRPSLSLTCYVRGFYPEAIDVQWLKGQESISGANSGDFG
ncbi:IGHE protein, partial [Chaetorhynchus papuensis]|nr:IGHE protein [Chaetorhynchus papuensis]